MASFLHHSSSHSLISPSLLPRQSYREAGDEVKHNFVYFSSPPKGAILRAAEAAAVEKGEQLPPPVMPVGAASTLLAAQPVSQGIFKGAGPLHGTPLLAPYGAVNPVDRRRIAARKFGTTFCYDFISVGTLEWRIRGLSPLLGVSWTPSVIPLRNL